MTGLPSRISDLQHEKTLTFLLRSNRIHLKPLDRSSVIDNFQSAFASGNKRITETVMNRLVNGVKGYAYAFQTVGYYAWEQSDNEITNQIATDALDLAKQDLYQNAYEKLYTEISNNDRKLIDLIAEYPNEEVPVTYLLKKFDKRKNYLSVYRARLLDDQLITAPQRGIVTLTLPFFADFIKWYKDLHLL